MTNLRCMSGLSQVNVIFKVCFDHLFTFLFLDTLEGMAQCV